MSPPWIVHKFGGTSLANAERYRQVAAIVRAENRARKVIIVSAMHKVTDALIGHDRRAKRSSGYFSSELHRDQIRTVDVTEERSILAAVGANMVDHPSVAGKFFSALGKTRVSNQTISIGVIGPIDPRVRGILNSTAKVFSDHGGPQ